jgi:small-conductance mechanosensitive channel
VDLWIL